MESNNRYGYSLKGESKTCNVFTCVHRCRGCILSSYLAQYVLNYRLRSLWYLYLASRLFLADILMTQQIFMKSFFTAFTVS